MTLTQQFAAYTHWRSQLVEGIDRYKRWLAENELSDAQTGQRFARLLEKLNEDRLYVAFLAEFSRGKSELINAVFFAEYGHRMLPSTAGRTTMCPTELLFDPGKVPCIELLPIETRGSGLGVGEYRRSPEAWRTVPLDIESPEAMHAALRAVSEVLHVPLNVAKALGFAQNATDNTALDIAADGSVEIPRWRHAIINFPHPLLQQGLVILDTPGLNAIGAEPGLTLSMLPNADATIFVLSADTGVTLSDLTIWKDYISASRGGSKGRMIVLNKIDGLWDELRSPAEINAEIDRQVSTCAVTLGVPTAQIFPISAQKGLVAKINGDEALLARSRINAFENALVNKLIPAKREIVRENTQAEFADIDLRARNLLEARLSELREQLAELTELRGKNKGVVGYMMNKIRVRKEEFEAGLERYYAVRSVFSQLSNQLYGHLGVGVVRRLATATRNTMNEANFSKTLSNAMRHFFLVTRGNLDQAERDVQEIHAMLEAVYRKFAVEHSLKLDTPMTFSLTRYQREIDRLESWCDTHLNTAYQFVTHDKTSVMQKFFGEIAVQMRHNFERANRDAELWLRTIMAPMEVQVHERQKQLKQRLSSIKRIHQATETLEERIDELRQTESDLLQQLQKTERIAQDVLQVFARQPAGAPVATAHVRAA